MKKIYEFLIRTTSLIMMVLFGIMLLVSFGVKAVYCYDDSPAFVRIQALDIVIFLGVLVFLMAGIYWREKLNHIFSVKLCVIVYIVCAVLFILLVPLKPFSDMQEIYMGALEIAKGNFAYFNQNIYFVQYPNNLLITIIYGGILFFLPKSFIVLKVFNIAVIIGIVYFSEKIIQIYWKNNYKNLFYLYSLAFGSVFIYVNHVYTDLLFVLISIIGIYFYLKNKKLLPGVLVLFSFLYFVRPQAIFYILTIIIHYLAKSDTRMIKKIGTMIVCAIIFLGSHLVVTYGIEKPIIGDVDHSMPVASYVYMAFNEEEFGFQDNTHSVDRTFGDVAERLEQYDVRTLTKIIVKKLQWTWTEGTYQAQRYGFGGDGVTQDKFAYETPVTKYCLDSSKTWRKILDDIFRAQYLILFLLTIPMFFLKNQQKFDVFIMIFAANLIFYIFWEIKSRYILPLYPIMLIMSTLTLKNVMGKISEKKG